MLQNSVSVWLDAVFGQVRDTSDEWMRCSAVIALVVVINNSLPVGIQFLIPFVIISIFSRNVELVHPVTLVEVSQLILPLYTGLLPLFGGLEVHPYEPSLVDMDMNGKEAMLALVEALDSVEPWCFREVALEAIRPAVVFATQDTGRAAALLDHRVRPVAADIVKPVDVPAAVPDEEERKVGEGERDKIAGFCEPKAMRD